jgi:hypothetical protein
LRGAGESDELDIPVRIIPRDEYLDSEREEANAEQDEARAQMRRGLALFGLEQRDTSAADAREQRARLVGGYYDPTDGSIALIDFGGGFAGDDVVMLVHEMVHALQDAAGQLAPKEPLRRFDEALARQAIVEGAATIVQDEAIALGYEYDFDQLDYRHALARYRGSSAAALAIDRSPFSTASMRFPYAYGASYLWPLRGKDGARDFAAVFDDLPVSTFAVMSGEPGRRPNDLGGAAVPVFPARPDRPELTLVGTYHLGRFLYHGGVGDNSTRIPEYALPWGDDFVADMLSVFKTEEGSVVAAYRVRFSGEDTLWRVADFIAEEGLEGVAGVEGQDLFWFEAEDEALLTDITSELSWRAAPELDFGYAEGEDARAGRVHCLRELASE